MTILRYVSCSKDGSTISERPEGADSTTRQVQTMTRMKIALPLALAAMLGLAASQPAQATTILVFGQTGQSTVTATNSGGVSTTINAANIPVTISQIENIPGAANISATLNLTAVSQGAANLTLSGNVEQLFNGSFSVTDGATNYLSGTFTNSLLFGSFASGPNTGNTLALQASQPPGNITFSTNSPLINQPFLPGFGISFALVNVTPGLHITGTSIGSFTASVAGNFSDNVGRGDIPVPEPASMLLLGTGLVGLGARLRRRK